MIAPLFIKTNNTLLKSLIRIDDLITYAKKNNIEALTITDENMYGVMEFYKKCKSNNIKPIIGLNIYNLVLYAKNYKGYQNLIKLSTISTEKDITIDDLKKYSSDLICILPFTYKNLYKEIKDIYSDLYIGYKNEKEKNSINIDKVYLNEILYINDSDKNYLKYLIAIKDSKLYIEIDDEFDNKLVINEDSKKIVDKCNLEFPNNGFLIPEYPDNEGDSSLFLKKLCINGLKSKFGSTAPKVYIDRLKYELDIINKMGFCDYFLIVWDYVKYAKENDIMVGIGRGSAAGSLVSYLLNITAVDPIKYNLFFERFLNPERISMPDIDIDFEDKRRSDVICYCKNKYGVKRVVPIIAFDTFGGRQAVRDIGKTLNLEQNLIDYLCKYIDSKLSLKDNYNSNQKLVKVLKEDKRLAKVYMISSKIEGIKRHTTIHAAGVIIGKNDLYNIIPLVKKDDSYLTGYSMEYLEELGLLKMDFLAISNLTTINNILKEAKNISFNEIPMNDKATLNLFNKAKTIGIFQFESSGMINFLHKLKVTSFEDVIAAIALFRPGPMKNIDSYIKRKNGLEKIDYIDDSLKDILKSTYGIIIYQEQIMQIASVMANYTLGEADVLRKAMSKKKEDILVLEKEKFIKRSIENGYSSEVATKVYNLIFKFASYGFNKAHSVAYAITAYKMAYLKVHYPLIFSKYMLSMYQTNEVKLQNFVYECKENNIKILPPSINKSGLIYEIIDNSIICPFNSIKGIGYNIGKTIVENRGDKYINIYDFMGKTYNKGISKKNLESLILSGSLEEFGYNRRTLYENLDVLLNFASIASEIPLEYAIIPDIEVKEEYPLKTLLKYELDLFGFYLTAHPVTMYKNKYNTINLLDIDEYFDKNVSLVLLVNNIKTITNKDNKKMMFITGSDELSSIDLTVFPNLYEEASSIKGGNIIYVKGRCEKRNGRYQIIVNEIKEI